MSKTYHRTYRRKGDVRLTLISLLVVAITVYSHILVAERVAYGLGGLIIAYLIYVKAYPTARRWLRINKNNSMSDVDRMSGLEFEKFIAHLLKKQGYTGVRLTEKYDYGVDIVAVKDGIRWGIQVKRYSGLVKAEAVRQVVTALTKYQCDRAMVISNSSYSKVAIDLAMHNSCVPIGRNELLRLAL